MRWEVWFCLKINLLVPKVLRHQRSGFWPREHGLVEASSLHRLPPARPRPGGGRGETGAQGDGRVNSSAGQSRELGGTAPGNPWGPRTAGPPCTPGGGSVLSGGASRCDNNGASWSLVMSGWLGRGPGGLLFLGLTRRPQARCSRAGLHMRK